MEYTAVTTTEIAQDETLADWRVLLSTLQADFTAPSFPQAAALVVSIAEAAERADHHPDVDLRYPGRLRVVLTTHATGGLTTRDVELARTISGLAAEAGAVSRPGSTSALELAIDTMDLEAIRPFWMAVLGYRDAPGEVNDPLRHLPPIWFQQLDEPRPQRNRIHLDITVPHDVAEQRVAAAIAAGGTLVSDDRAKAFWVLADADGNEVCVCTWQDRGR